MPIQLVTAMIQAEIGGLVHLKPLPRGLHGPDLYSLSLTSR